MFAIVDEVKERGATVFFSSHHLDEVERIADRVGAIREGRMVAVDTVAGLKSRAERRIEVVFGEPVAAEEFARIDGVQGGAGCGPSPAHDGRRSRSTRC